MNKLVIYTSITGGYDTLRDPKTIYDDTDYICFCDDTSHSQVGVWQIKPIPYRNRDNTRRARFVKHNPHIVVPEYEYSVWIDSNIQIIDDYLQKRVAKLINNGSVIAQITHPHRNCIYDEAAACILCTRDNPWRILRTAQRLRREGFPAKYGLTETNIIFRKHNDSGVLNISNEWWNFITRYSKRDQLSFHYILWRNNLEIDLLLPLGIDTYSTEHFNRVPHRDKSWLEERIEKAERYLAESIFVKIYKKMINLQEDYK